MPFSSGVTPCTPAARTRRPAAQGFVSGVNFANKRTVLILFINGRLVECSGLKRTLEALYSNVVPGSKGGPSGGAGSKPWVFLDLQLPPRQVEVNLHPTKREVGFLHQDHIVEAIRCVLRGVQGVWVLVGGLLELRVRGGLAAPGPH